jgi:hypothetical protein
MQIKIEGPEGILEEFRLYLHDEFLKRGFTQGPKMDRIESGLMIEYLKDGEIVSIEVSSKREGKDSQMVLEANKQNPETYEIWDEAVIRYAKQSLHRILTFGQNKEKVNKALGK